MSKPVGGRGKTAPYVSTHVRVPQDIKPYIEFLKDQYHEGKLEDFEVFVSHFKQDYQSTSNILQEIDNLKSQLAQNEEVIACQKAWISSLSASSSLPSFANARNYADTLIKQKKSARICLLKLLQFIYGK